MPQNNILENGRLVDTMRYAILEGEKNIKHIPIHLKRVIEAEAWKNRWLCSHPQKFETFLEFINTPPLDGMGWSTVEDKEMVERLLREDQDVLKEWRRLTKLPAGTRTDLNNNVIEVRHAVQGNSRAYTLERLDRENRDLYARVIAGEMSANAAAIAAGWREKPTPLAMLRRAWKKASAGERQTFLNEVSR